MVTYLSKQLIQTDIFIEPKEITLELNENILNKLIEKNEGKCNSIGYVLKDSIEIVEKSYGKITYINNINNVQYVVKYICDIIKPTLGETVKCCVENKTDAGIIAYVKLKDIIPNYIKENDITNTPIICIIPLNKVDDSNNILKGQRLNIQISAIRNKLNHDNIQVIGTPV
tara:strand:- start:392 stop:904 length:513 start_codon:yes stop_codon:yes gene_type:complete